MRCDLVNNIGNLLLFFGIDNVLYVYVLYIFLSTALWIKLINTYAPTVVVSYRVVVMNSHSFIRLYTKQLAGHSLERIPRQGICLSFKLVSTTETSFITKIISITVRTTVRQRYFTYCS